MAGVDCWELFTLLLAFFSRGTEFQEDPFNYLDGAPKICPPLDLTDTDEDEEEASASTQETEPIPPPQIPVTISHVSTTKVEMPLSATAKPTTSTIPWDPPVKFRSKTFYPDKVSDISAAMGFFPEDKESLHNTRIPAIYTVRRSGTSSKGQSLYLCPYGDRCSNPPYSGDIASAGSHIRRHHLGHCIQCPYDGTRFYNGAGWRDHMCTKHPDAPWYRSQLGIDSKLPDSFLRLQPP